ncbi:MAG: regulatory protein RecX [Oscillospiraceae bacterium]|nr:regulatory protein RecX [Oscillospiraceae bacterium]
MKIEKIERSKHQQERILVHLEGGDLLRITEDELLHFGLYTGLDIDDATVVKLQKCSARSQTKARAANMISARPLSRRELEKRLRDKGATDEDAASAADWLENIGALDDAAYAAMLVRHYSAAGYGAARIRDELFRRGVPREYWEDALALIPDPQESIRRLIETKTKGRSVDEKQRRRLADALLRRGFPWDAVKSAINALGESIEEE